VLEEKDRPLMGLYGNMFKQDLELGKKIEHIVCDYIVKKKYPKAYVVEGYNKGYDIVVPEVNQTIEVKYDSMSNKTGNYMIETEYNGKESGLTTTTADWWLQVDNEVAIWIKPSVLEFILKDYKIIKMAGIGDSKDKSGYLIPREKLINTPYVFVTYHSNKIKLLIKQ